MANSPTSSPGSGGRLLAKSVLYVCGAWLVIVGILYVATGSTLPTINVRWAPSVTAEQRMQLEQQFSLVLQEPGNQRTGRYFVTDPTVENLKQIVISPMVEDTAFVSRSTFVLEGAPQVHMWMGDRVRILKNLVLLGLCVIGVVASAGTLLFRRG
jgi:hypothetical protein